MWDVYILFLSLCLFILSRSFYVVPPTEPVSCFRSHFLVSPRPLSPTPGLQGPLYTDIGSLTPPLMRYPPPPHVPGGVGLFFET